MTSKVPLLVFTDLDGTLIDHNTYQWAAARPALEAVHTVGGGVILASSKTAPEIVALRQELGLQAWPAIVENGAGLVLAQAKTVDAATDYAQIRAALYTLSGDMRSRFVGFGDMTTSQVVKATGLTEVAATLAKTRNFSEPGLWRGTADQRVDFETALHAKGITAREGGRFLTLSLGCKKSDQMASIIDAYRPQHTIALGDAPNDIEMLEAADFGVIVANPDHAPLPTLKGEAQGRIIRTSHAGPAGWNTAVLDLLARLT